MARKQRERLDASLGELIEAVYEAALEELQDVELAQRVTAELVTEVVLRCRVEPGAQRDSNSRTYSP